MWKEINDQKLRGHETQEQSHSRDVLRLNEMRVMVARDEITKAQRLLPSRAHREGQHKPLNDSPILQKSQC